MLTKLAFQNQLKQKILPFWLTQKDPAGGFYGRYTADRNVDVFAPKGGVMAGRFLWTFSRSYRLLGETDLMEAANHAYTFLTTSILDHTHGGAYWQVDATGTALETLKHTYAQSFCIYGLSEYAEISNSTEAMEHAVQLYRLVEEKAYDEKHKGYLEEFTREWNPKKDSQISSNHPQLAFTMNTHLHLLEAYTNLYRIWPDEGLKRKIECLLDIFAENIYSSEGFCWTEFDVNWQPLISEVSYGHDIETSWLLKETLDICQIKNEKIEQMTLKLAEYVLEHGLDEYGALYNHYHFQTKKTDRTRVWWVQAEAVVGFYHAYQITGDETFLAAANKVWLYIQTFFIDKRSNSEWFSRLDAHNQILSSKLGNDGSSLEPISDSWKGPYHTVRMYIEIIERLGGKGNDGME